VADVEATVVGLDALAARVSAATGDTVADALHLIQAAAMNLAPVGTVGNSTNMPGDLRRSIAVEGPVETGEHSWAGRVGPTTVYGRQRELGGPIYPVLARRLRFEKFGAVYFRSRVYQHPHPYLKPGAESAMPAIEAVRDERLTAAIEGG
jgi:hypothetical protein